MTTQGSVSSKGKRFLLCANANATILELVVGAGEAANVDLCATVLEAAREMKLAVPIDEAAVKKGCASAFKGEAV